MAHICHYGKMHSGGNAATKIRNVTFFCPPPCGDRMRLFCFRFIFVPNVKSEALSLTMMFLSGNSFMKDFFKNVALYGSDLGVHTRCCGCGIFPPLLLRIVLRQVIRKAIKKSQTHPVRLFRPEICSTQCPGGATRLYAVSAFTRLARRDTLREAVFL